MSEQGRREETPGVIRKTSEKPTQGSDPNRDVRKTNHTKLAQSPICIRISATKKAQRSHWRFLSEAPICHGDNLSREVYCLPGACICDITKWLLCLVGPQKYHPFLLFQIGSNCAVTRKLQNIKKDFTSPGFESVRRTPNLTTVSINLGHEYDCSVLK